MHVKNEQVDIVQDPDAIALVPRLTVYSAFIHFKTQLKNDIKNLDKYSIDQVSSLVNTGTITGEANHAEQRKSKYNSLINGEFKCDEGN